MQGCKHGEGMNKSEMGLRSLGQGSWIRARNGECQAGSRCGVPKMETKVCGRAGYAVEDFRMSLGHGNAWVGVPVLHVSVTRCPNFRVTEIWSIVKWWIKLKRGNVKEGWVN